MAESNVLRKATCEWCKEDTWCETRHNGKPQCRACKVEKYFQNFLFKPLGYQLLKWHRKALRSLYGNLSPDTGERLYRKAMISMAKQNGKSFLMGGLPIYHLLMEDIEISPEAYGAAAAKEQAGLVFKSCAALIRGNPVLMDKLKIIDSTKRIVRRDGGGTYTVLSADGDVQDGIRPSLAIIDELHRWRTKKAEILFQVMTKGMISRREPLAIEITTVGEQNESPLWWSEYEYALRVLDGSLPTEDFYAMIYSADAKRCETEADYWKSREARVAANPSHEDNGGFLKDAALVAELNSAIAKPGTKPEYLRYHLNVPASAGEERVIEMPIWCEGGNAEGIGIDHRDYVDLRTWPEYDVDLLVMKWGLKNRPCFAGVDAAWTTDLTAVTLVFPPQDHETIWRILGFAWLPKERLMELGRKCRAPFAEWARRGFLESTPGNAVDLEAIKEKIRWAGKMFDLREVPFDPWNFRTEGAALNREGFTAVDVRQGYQSLSEPTKKFLELYITRNLIHGNNPLMNWNASCLSIDMDNDNAKPSKGDRNKSGKRIDMIAAAITAMNRAIAAPSAPTFGALVV